MLVPTARAPSRPSNSAVAASADYARRLAFACDVQCVAAAKQIASNRQRGDESKASRCSHDSRRPWRRPDRRFATALIRDLTGLQPMAEIAKMCTGSGTAVLRIFLPRGAPRCTYCSALRARQNRTRRTACALSSRCAAICRCWARLPTTRTESAAQLVSAARSARALAQSRKRTKRFRIIGNLGSAPPAERRRLRSQRV